MNEKNTPNRLIIFLGLALIMVMLAAGAIKENKYNPTLGDGRHNIEPTKIENIESAKMSYTFEEFEIDETNNTFLFYTNHLEVFVYADEELIYSLKRDNSVFGRTPGAMWNIMSLPVDVEMIQVDVIQAYPSLAQQDIKFELGNAIVMQREVVMNTLVDVSVCLCIMMIGIALFFYWFMVFRKMDEQKELLYLGLFACIFGVWAFGETQLAVFMFSHRAFWSYMAFTCLMIMCLPFLLFAKEFLETEDKYLHKCIASYIVIETVVAQILHITGIVSVKESVYFTLASILMTMVYVGYAIITAIQKKKNRRKIIANILGLFALAATAIIDMGGYFTNVSEANQLGKVGFLIYAVILGVETARIAQEQVQEAHKAEIYREMAHKDVPTGCYNRNAFAEDTSIGMELEGVQVVTFDLNNLKKCNDTKGHMAGDKYIADAATMVQNIFGDLGKVYRIGGDEFCVIVKAHSKEIIESRRKLLKDAIITYRKETGDDNFGIACGYAIYDASLDKNLEETRDRADVWMYENKKEIKGLN